jgi:hypothetical protein
MAAPMTITSARTVFTSQRSCFGPVTRMNDQMCTIGQTPVRIK